MIQCVHPISASIAPWPSLEGLAANAFIVPILAGQMLILTIGLFCIDDEDDRAVRPAKER